MELITLLADDSLEVLSVTPVTVVPGPAMSKEAGLNRADRCPSVIVELPHVRVIRAAPRVV